MSIAIMIHIIAATIWVGGMFFAYIALRPIAAAQLEPPLRLNLWVGVFSKFFPWVWVAIAGILASGYWMALTLYGTVANFPLYINLMQGLGIIMVLIFGHVYFGGYKPLSRLVADTDYPAAGKKLNQIRKLIGLNLSIGLIVVAIASGGRYGMFG